MNRHSGQECNPQKEKKIVRGERQGLHPTGLAKWGLRAQKGTRAATSRGTIGAMAKNSPFKRAVSLSATRS